MPYLINCTQCPANSYQPTAGAKTSSACIICPAGQSPVAANAGSCSSAAKSKYSTTLYLAVGIILGGVLLAAAALVLVMRRLRRGKSPEVVDVEQPVVFGDAGIVVAMLEDPQTKPKGTPKHTRMHVHIPTQQLIYVYMP
jgi:hypothetical protein